MSIDIDFIDTSIGSYEARVAQCDKAAIGAITEGAYSVALLKVAEAMSYRQAIDELRFQLEAAEVNNA